MRSTQFILIRHGQTIWNFEGRLQGHLDSPLTELGLLQTERIADRLASQPHHAIYSSDLQRTSQAAKLIAEKTGNSVVMDKRLRERNYGILEGLTRTEMKEKYPKEFSLLQSGEPDYAIPEGETESNFFKRCVACLEDLAQRHTGQTILVVTHLGVLNCLFRHVLGIPLDAPRRFKALEGSLNSIYFKRGVWVLETWGDVSHLK